MPRNVAHDNTAAPLTLPVAFSYALPVLPLMLLISPIAVLQGIYAKYFGFSLTTIATVILITRLFDAVIDPLVGYCADRYCAKGGSRRPFVVCGGVLIPIAAWFLYVPPANVSVGYFLGWFLAFYLAYTLFEIPHLAWGGNLASSARDKNTLYSLRTACTLLGGLSFYGLPLLPIFATSEITPETLKWSVGVAAAVMLPSLLFCVLATPGSGTWAHHKNRPQTKDSLFLVFRSIATNAPLMLTLLASACVYLSIGMTAFLFFLFVDAYLSLGDKFALVSMLNFGVGLVSLALWHSLVNRWGLQRTWVVAVIVLGIGMAGLGLMSPGSHWLFILLWTALSVAGMTAVSIIVPSLLSHAADYGTWKFGTDRSATCFSLFTLLNKTLNSIGGAAGLAIAGWYGFTATQTSQSESAVLGLRLSMVWIPLGLLLVGAVLAARIPLSAKQHAVIRRRLAARQPRVIVLDKTISVRHRIDVEG